MLRKLLKYDFKSGIRVFGFLWLGILGVAGLSCLTNAIGDPESEWRIMLGIFGLFPMIIAIMGATIYPYVYGATRFYKGLLGREGYLMFTLPTTPWKLLTSKLITVVCFTIVTVIVVIIGMALAVGGFIAPMVDMGPSFPDVFEGVGLDGYGLATILSALVSLITGFLQIYLACCLGHLCRSKRVLWSVLFYMALSLGASMITSFIQVVTMSRGADGFGEMMESILYLDIPFKLGLGILYFFLSERILRTKLNLE